MFFKNVLKSAFSLEHPYAIAPVDGTDCVVSLIARNEINGHVTLRYITARKP